MSFSYYPRRDGEPVCRDFIRTGRCKYGESCKYNHPIGGVSSLCDPSEPLFPLRFGEPSCPYYLKHGFCKFGQSCKFHHPTTFQDSHSENIDSIYANFNLQTLKPPNSGTKYRSAFDNTESVVVITNTTVQTLPQRPSEPTCSYYMRTGTCKFGLYCRYNHPTREDSTRDESIDGALISLHSPTRRDRRCYSIGSVLETRRSDLALQDLSHDVPTPSLSLYTTVQSPSMLGERSHEPINRNDLRGSNDHRETMNISGARGLLLRDLYSNKLPTQWSLPGSQRVSNSVTRSETRGRSLSNNDLYDTNLNRSLYEINHGTKVDSPGTSHLYQPQRRYFFFDTYENENVSNEMFMNSKPTEWSMRLPLSNGQEAIETTEDLRGRGSAWTLDFSMTVASNKGNPTPSCEDGQLWKYP